MIKIHLTSFILKINSYCTIVEASLSPSHFLFSHFPPSPPDSWLAFHSPFPLPHLCISLLHHLTKPRLELSSPISLFFRLLYLSAGMEVTRNPSLTSLSLLPLSSPSPSSAIPLPLNLLQTRLQCSMLFSVASHQPLQGEMAR